MEGEKHIKISLKTLSLIITLVILTTGVVAALIVSTMLPKTQVKLPSQAGWSGRPDTGGVQPGGGTAAQNFMRNNAQVFQNCLTDTGTLEGDIDPSNLDFSQLRDGPFYDCMVSSLKQGK